MWAIATGDEEESDSRLPVTETVDGLVNAYLQALWLKNENAVLNTFHPASRQCIQNDPDAISRIIHSQYIDGNIGQYQKKHNIVKFIKLGEAQYPPAYSFIDSSGMELLDTIQATHKVLFNMNAFNRESQHEDSLIWLYLVKAGVNEFYIAMPCLRAKSSPAQAELKSPEEMQLMHLVESLEQHKLEDFQELLSVGNESDAKTLISIYLHIKIEDKEKVELLLKLIKSRLSASTESSY